MNQANGSTFYLKLKMRTKELGIFSEMLVCGDYIVTVTTSCTKLTRYHAVGQIGTL